MAEWRIEPEAIGVSQVGTHVRVQLSFSGAGASAGVREAMERLWDEPIAEGVRAACADLPGLARLGDLRREFLAVQAEAARVQATARRTDAERAEAALFAKPGWSQVVVEKEAELKRLSDEFDALAARCEAVKNPIRDAREVVREQARSARFETANGVQRGLHARREAVLAKIGPAVGEFLEELLSLEYAIGRGANENRAAAMGVGAAPGPEVSLDALADRAAKLAEIGRSNGASRVGTPETAA